jgi:hypothetical protein
MANQAARGSGAAGGAPFDLRRHLREAGGASQRGKRHQAGEHEKQRGAAMRGDRRRHRRIEQDRADAERRADDGEQLVRIGAAADGAVDDRQGDAGGDAGDEVQRSQAAEGGRLRGAEEGQRGDGIAGGGAGAARQAVEQRRRGEAGAHRAEQEGGDDHAGVFQVEAIVLGERADPDRQRDQVDHADEVAQHERGAAAPAVRDCAQLEGSACLSPLSL